MWNKFSCKLLDMHDILWYNNSKTMEVLEMANNINVTIRLDRDVKERAEQMFEDLGMSLSTAINVFVRQSLRHGGVPFELNDPFYSEKNQAELSRRIAEIEAGTAKLTVRDLIEDEDYD